MGKYFTRKPPKRGRFDHDVWPEIEYNAATGKARVLWHWWAQSGVSIEYAWHRYKNPIFSNRVGDGSAGPRLYPVHHFRSMKAALRHVHKVMQYADLWAFREFDHERAETEDWRIV